MHTQPLQGWEEALGPKHTSTLHTVNNLGNLYADQGKLAEAEKMYTRALQGYEEALGLNHTSTHHTAHNTGTNYADLYTQTESKNKYKLMHKRDVSGNGLNQM